jgi:hypothetical protein
MKRLCCDGINRKEKKNRMKERKLEENIEFGFFSRSTNYEGIEENTAIILILLRLNVMHFYRTTSLALGVHLFSLRFYFFGNK